MFKRKLDVKKERKMSIINYIKPQEDILCLNERKTKERGT